MSKTSGRRSPKQLCANHKWCFGDFADLAVNVVTCLVILSVPCFIFGYSGLGFILLGVSAVIVLLILAAFFFGAVVAAKILKNIPHR